MQRDEDLLLGKLAVREGACTQEQVDECLRLQSNSKESPPLGDMLLFKGYLSEAKLKDLQGRHQKKVMSCPACKLSFTVFTMSEGKSARCPRCKGTLEAARPNTPIRTDAEFATQRFKVAAPPPAPSGPKLSVVCKICDHAFTGSPDASGRIRCPACQSSFNAR